MVYKRFLLLYKRIRVDYQRFSVVYARNWPFYARLRQFAVKSTWHSSIMETEKSLKLGGSLHFLIVQNQKKATGNYDLLPLFVL